VNPPYTETGHPSEAPPAPLPGPYEPPAAAVEEPTDAPSEERDPREGSPAPVHVPYARTGAEPEPVVARPSAKAGRPKPSRSPFWAAVRSHVWLFVIILLVVGVAGSLYWGLRVHQRISKATLERGIASREHASTVRCVEQQRNGAVWACGLVYRAASVCLIADVNPVGDWNTNDGPGLCDHRPELAAILPADITAAAVSADMESQLGIASATCAKVPEHKVRWACLGPSSGGGGGDCLLVRVAPWSSLGTEPSDVCDHVPTLRDRQN
jgi:hypothetical protein